jgi:hypothetical protein
MHTDGKQCLIRVNPWLNRIFPQPAARRNGDARLFTLTFGAHQIRAEYTGSTGLFMTEEEKDKAKAAAVAGAGATVGTVGGATAGVLELAARGLATGVTAGAVIGLGAVAGAGLAWGIYRYFKKPRA